MEVGAIIKDPVSGSIYKCTKTFLYFGIMAVRWTQNRWNANDVHLYSCIGWQRVKDPSINNSI